MMLIDFEPGDYVTNPANKDWGLGQVQSIIDWTCPIPQSFFVGFST